MERGFYTALGTPLTENGDFCPQSMTLQIEQQIAAGASGLLVMGSMGQETYIKQSEYAKVAACSVEAAKGRVPVLVGVTDVSIHRVMDRVAALGDLSGIDGVVSTVPYYSGCTQEDIFCFYSAIADRASCPVYLYDLAVVTKTATSADTVKRLWKNPNIKGIKSGNLVTLRTLLHAQDRPENFSLMFSNIDEFDIAYPYGIDKNLDGMFSCTPKTAKMMYDALAAGNAATAAEALDRILSLRDLFISTGCLMMAYSHAMNLLGCGGCFGYDYHEDIPAQQKVWVAEAMKALGEI